MYSIFRLKNYHYNMFLGRRHPTEQHEILGGIVAKPGGDYIHSVYRHRRVLQQSRQIFHGQKMYFLDLISQNPGCIEIQVWELVYTYMYIFYRKKRHIILIYIWLVICMCIFYKSQSCSTCMHIHVPCVHIVCMHIIRVVQYMWSMYVHTYNMHTCSTCIVMYHVHVCMCVYTYIHVYIYMYYSHQLTHAV
jgi:hypothetical protein